MKTAKQEVLSTLEALPDDVALDAIVQELAFKAKILRSVGEADRGELIPNDQIMRELDDWLLSLGHPPRAQTSRP